MGSEWKLWKIYKFSELLKLISSVALRADNQRNSKFQFIQKSESALESFEYEFSIKIPFSSFKIQIKPSLFVNTFRFSLVFDEILTKCRIDASSLKPDT